MIDVVVVSVRHTGNTYYLSPGHWNLKKNDKVVIDTENGLQVGVLIKEKYKEKSENLVLPLDKIVRICTDEDLLKDRENKKQAKEALLYAKNCIKDLDMDMNFVDSYYNLDKSQLIFSFVSENRQIGVRDKAKRVGGIGPCGLFLCCNTFLTDFNSVSINMAKNQLLALNPSKINGTCGRLLCCLSYENDVYTELKKDLPKIGMVADTKMGMGKVVDIDIFKSTYKVDLGERGIVEFSKDDK